MVAGSASRRRTPDHDAPDVEPGKAAAVGWYNAAGTAEAVAARAVVTTAMLAIVVVAMVVFSVRGSQLEKARAYTTRLVQRTRIGVWNLPAALGGAHNSYLSTARASLVIANVSRTLRKQKDSPSGYKYVYSSEPVALGEVVALCDAVDQGDTDVLLDFAGGPLKFGLKKATVRNTSLCDLEVRVNGSVRFLFEHQETGRAMHGVVAKGQLTCGEDSDSSSPTLCKFSAEAILRHGSGASDQTTPSQPAWPPVFVPPTSEGFLEDFQLEVGNVTADGHIYNGAIERFDGGLVLAYRLEIARQPKETGHRVAVVDLDENFVPQGTPLIIEPAMVGRHVEELEDVRLTAHDGQLYIQFVGMMRRFEEDGSPIPLRLEGRQWLARLERVKASEMREDAPAFRFVAPRRLLAPAGMGMRLVEKGWPQFIHNGSFHFMTEMNPPLVVRAPDTEGIDGDIVTELVSHDKEAVQWRYGGVRGGSPAVFDPALGAYVALFHSSVQHSGNGTLGPCRGPGRNRRTYYMGCMVFGAKPPFSVQQMLLAPLGGPDMYSGDTHQRQGWKVVFPLGLIIEGDTYVISYGKNDADTRVARFDRNELLAAMQPPVPANWDGQLETNC